MFNKPFLRERESVTDSISLSLSVCVCVYVCLALAGLELDIQLALDSHRSTCLCLLSGGIKGERHHCLALSFLRKGNRLVSRQTLHWQAPPGHPPVSLHRAA